MNRIVTIISALVICIIACLSWAINYYRDNAITYEAQHDKNVRELMLANAVIIDIQTHRHDVAVLDTKYTKELVGAKAESDAPRDDATVGRYGLRVKTVHQSVREATIASNVDNAVSPRLADTTKQDCLALRKKLITVRKQLEKTQRYIDEQCRWGCPYRWAIHAIIVSNTHALPAEYKCLK